MFLIFLKIKLGAFYKARRGSTYNQLVWIRKEVNICTNSLGFLVVFFFWFFFFWFFSSINSLKLHIKLGNRNPTYLTKNTSHNAMENKIKIQETTSIHKLKVIKCLRHLWVKYSLLLRTWKQLKHNFLCCLLWMISFLLKMDLTSIWGIPLGNNIRLLQ